MSAPDNATLYDFEDQIETALRDILVAAVAAVVPALTCQVIKSRDTDDKITPRIEVEFATGAAMDQRGAFGQADPRQVPTAFGGQFTITIATTRPLDSAPYAITHGTLRGLARYTLTAGAKLFNATNLPYLQLLRVLPAGTSPNMQEHKEQDVTILTYAVQFAIRNDAFPATG